MKLQQFFKLLISIVLCQTAGIIGSIFTVPAISIWYASLNKPEFTPPDWLFGPVWFLLYTLMGIALYLVWQKGIKKKEVKSAVILFIIHLAFNSLWSILFFGLQNLLVALFEIFILWLMIIVLIWRFSKIQKWSACLLIPYLLWVSFAMALNFGIWLWNR